jgi:hypothetical protein
VDDAHDDSGAGWLDDETTPEAVAEEKRLADELRRIIHRLVLVRPDAEDLRRAADGAQRFADELDRLRPRAGAGEVSEAGLRPNDPIRHSPLSGTSNPLAPPMVSWQIRDGEDGPQGRRTEGTVRFGAAYEGPPRHVHGGLVAAMFDELLGRSQLVPGFTGSLTIWYRRPTPLAATCSCARGSTGSRAASAGCAAPATSTACCCARRRGCSSRHARAPACRASSPRSPATARVQA